MILGVSRGLNRRAGDMNGPGGEPSIPVSQLFKRHPWHGVSIGAEAPALVTCYIEIVPTDTVKYELDKTTGHLKIDRPQKYSSVCPTLYGLLPQTYCGERVAEACRQRTGRPNIVGDGDPLDICVLVGAADQPRRHLASRSPGGRISDDRSRSS